MWLDPVATASGVRLVTYSELGSTNAEALVRARRGERGPLWVAAEKQTAGRGRHGRAWISERGNFHATLLLIEPASAPHAPELAFVAALAVHDAVSKAAPALQPQLRLKWPNDLLYAGAKLAGILIEGEGTAVAVGIGINCRHHPTTTTHPATDLSACGARVSPADLMMVLSRSMCDRLDQWAQGQGFAAIRRDWLARGQEHGSAISVRIGERQLGGRFEGVDDSGRLRLRSDDGTLEMITAGDVFLSNPQSAPAMD